MELTVLSAFQIQTTVPRASSPVECLRTLSEPLSREPFRSPSDRDDLISLCLSLLFTCRYYRQKKMPFNAAVRERRQGRARRDREIITTPGKLLC